MVVSNVAYEPKIVVVLTTYKDPPLFRDICGSIKSFDYSNFEVLIVDCLSAKTRQIVDEVKLQVPVHWVGLQQDKGAAHQLNVGMRSALDLDEAKYVVRIEGDAIPFDSKLLKELVNVMENNENVAIAMPFDKDSTGKEGYGGRLYGNCTQCPIPQPPSRIIPCIGTGGHCFITRTKYLKELFDEEIMPYWSPLYISSEDLDFNLKAWLRSYKVVTIGSVHVLHGGTSMTKDGSYRAPYRVYHMYKNRLCLLLLNFGYKHILTNVWYRFLHDMLSAIVYSEIIPMIRGYLWVALNQKRILQQRELRMTRWKRISDDELKPHVLIRLPMPIRK